MREWVLVRCFLEATDWMSKRLLRRIPEELPCCVITARGEAPSRIILYKKKLSVLRRESPVALTARPYAFGNC
jgi:hypothetical protein